MGASSANGNQNNQEKNNQDDFEFIESLPDDQYSCPNCGLVPEITNIYYDTNEIEIKCQIHGVKKLPLKNFFLKESKYLYSNIECGICHKKKKLYKTFYKYCYHCKNPVCYDCSLRHHNHDELINFNEFNNRCEEHEGDCNFLIYCFTCNKNICSKISETKHKDHQKEIISKFKPNKDEIELLRINTGILKKDKELLTYLYKINNTLLSTYEEHPNNYNHNINISNIVKSLATNHYDLFINMLNDKKKLIKQFNDKFEKKVSGAETVLNLNEISLGNKGLSYLRKIDFDDLRILNLENNNIEDISCFNGWNLIRLKTLNLKNNEIRDISIIKKIFEISNELENIYLNNNKISNIDALNDDVIIKNKKLKEINLKGNSIDYNSSSVKEIIKKFNSKIKK